MLNDFPVFKNRNVQKIYKKHPALQEKFTAGEKLQIRMVKMWQDNGHDIAAVAETLGVKIQAAGKAVASFGNAFRGYKKGYNLKSIANFNDISQHLAFYFVLMGIQNEINDMLGEKILNIMEE